MTPHSTPHTTDAHPAAGQPADRVPVAREIFPGEVFANTADFDTGIRQLLPRYDEMLDTIVRCIRSSGDASGELGLRILELGSGTGELSLKILNRCPATRVVAVDYSPRMIESARAKIEAAGYGDRWTAIEADFGDFANQEISLGEGFDACVSSLAIHHLSDEMKLKLFQSIREILRAGGCFWNGDLVLAESPAIADVYRTVREEWAVQQGTTLAEIRTKIGTTRTQGHSSQDQLATLTCHLQMLATAGFDPVVVPWKYYGWAVFGGLISAGQVNL